MAEGHATGPNSAGETSHIRTHSKSPRQALNCRREPEEGATAAARRVPVLAGAPHHATCPQTHSKVKGDSHPMDRQSRSISSIANMTVNFINYINEMLFIKLFTFQSNSCLANFLQFNMNNTYLSIFN